MKMAAFFFFLISSIAHAGCYQIEATCGEVRKTGNGKILRRLEPNLFGINAKFVLKTKFENHVVLNEYSCSKKEMNVFPLTNGERKTAFTKFSDKEKFVSLKKEFKAEIKKSKKSRETLYACVGHIKVEPMKYSGSHVFFNSESTDAAVEQMRRQARRHL